MSRWIRRAVAAPTTLARTAHASRTGLAAPIAPIAVVALSALASLAAHAVLPAAAAGRPTVEAARALELVRARPVHAGAAATALRPGAGDVARAIELQRAHPGEVGMNARTLARVDTLLEQAIRQGVTPGAALAVGRRGRLVRLQGYGRVDWRPGFPAVTERTLYDVASLTKAVATTTAVMLLVQDGLLELDAPIARYLPWWVDAGPKALITPRQLLSHTSGLPVGYSLARFGWSREGILLSLAEVPLRAPPGTQTAYSDYGMIVLAALAEELSGLALDELLLRRVFGPLGMEDTGFNPVRWQPDRVHWDPRPLPTLALLGAGSVRRGVTGDEPAADDVAPADAAAAAGFAAVLRGPPGHDPAAASLENAVAAALLERVAPTEQLRPDLFRHGVVHDRTAAALGGVAGHAGLFSSARDLAGFAQLLLNRGEVGAMRVLEPEVVDLFTRRDRASRFALGWERSLPSVPVGSAFSTLAFGHTGFTGTSIWIDPADGLFVILLTNRLNPSAREQRHVQLRREVHAAVKQAVLERYAD
jgi:CubicO group peptidase (beta-lactamase class C family)